MNRFLLTVLVIAAICLTYYSYLSAPKTTGIQTENIALATQQEEPSFPENLSTEKELTRYENMYKFKFRSLHGGNYNNCSIPGLDLSFRVPSTYNCTSQEERSLGRWATLTSNKHDIEILVDVKDSNLESDEPVDGATGVDFLNEISTPYGQVVEYISITEELYKKLEYELPNSKILILKVKISEDKKPRVTAKHKESLNRLFSNIISTLHYEN